MFNPKIYEHAREIVAHGDITDLTNRVYRQICAEAELNRLSERNTTTNTADCSTERGDYDLD